MKTILAVLFFSLISCYYAQTQQFNMSPVNTHLDKNQLAHGALKPSHFVSIDVFGSDIQVSATLSQKESFLILFSTLLGLIIIVFGLHKCLIMIQNRAIYHN